MTNSKRVRWLELRCVASSALREAGRYDREHIPVLRLLPEEAEIDLENGLQQAHVGTLVQTDLVLPQVNQKDFGRCQREESRFSFEILERPLRNIQRRLRGAEITTNLVFASLPPVCALHIHDHDVHVLAFTHPDTCNGTTSLDSSYYARREIPKEAHASREGDAIDSLPHTAHRGSQEKSGDSPSHRSA